MTIPLDNLYHYIDGLFPEPVCIYLFYPHGSRDILNLTLLSPPTKVKFNLDSIVWPQMICNDQEPLNYEMYQTMSDKDLEYFNEKLSRSSNEFHTNLKAATTYNIYDKTLLLHSEKNSLDLEKYENDLYIGVYYWCHAIIARDWYRYAQYDNRLVTNSNSKQNFLIYCRGWSGHREYRIKFQELLYQHNLTEQSITGIKKVSDCNCSIEHFKFKNHEFIPKNFDFFYNLLDNQHASNESARYCPEDFNNTHISVVLETIFDGTKIHLTEKILRPIACGHPFMLAAGPGSLEYLRQYGFKTFSPWINEDYDLEFDSVQRLEKIIYSMKEYSHLSNNDQQLVRRELLQIAEYNKKWFFSDQFANIITN